MGVFNTDKQTGKNIGRSYMDAGMAQPTQFNSPIQHNSSVGYTTNIGSHLGGGMGKANNDAGKAVGRMPNIPLGAL